MIRRDFFALTAAVALGLFVSFGWAAIAAAPKSPKAPVGLCIDEEEDGCLPQAEPEGVRIKWHPGHYMEFASMDWTVTNQQRHFAQIDKIANDDKIKGVELRVSWGTLETSRGDYRQGFAIVDAYLEKLASLPTRKQLMLTVMDRAFGSSSTSVLPSYLNTLEFSGGWIQALPKTLAGNLTLLAKVWEQPTMDRLIALSQAFAERYDTNPNFEMFSVEGETAMDVPDGAGYTCTAYVTQIKRWMAESRKAWPHTALRLYANWIEGDARMIELFDFAVAYDIAVGGPDTERPLPNITKNIQAPQVFRALRGGGSDFRGKTPWVGENQVSGYNETENLLPEQIIAHQNGTMRMSYMVWYRNDWTGSAAQRWETGILPAIHAANGMVQSTQCPQNYPGCDTD